MTRRSRAREVALQVLFQSEANPDRDPGELDGFLVRRLVTAPLVLMARQLVRGVQQHAPQIDARIEKTSAHWRLFRMAATDRAVLRIGAYELLHTDTPPRVVVDEAVMLAKRFGNDSSAAFVNGILGTILNENKEALEAALTPTPLTESLQEPDAAEK